MERITRIALTAVLALVVTASFAASAVAAVDLRSPDTKDAARQAELQSPSPGPAPTQVDLRSPDTRDVANGTTGPSSVGVITVTKASPSGFDWGDAGIGAGVIAGALLLLGSGMLLATHRRVSFAKRPGTAFPA